MSGVPVAASFGSVIKVDCSINQKSFFMYAMRKISVKMASIKLLPDSIYHVAATSMEIRLDFITRWFAVNVNVMVNSMLRKFERKKLLNRKLRYRSCWSGHN